MSLAPESMLFATIHALSHKWKQSEYISFQKYKPVISHNIQNGILHGTLSLMLILLSCALKKAFFDVVEVAIEATEHVVQHR